MTHILITDLREIRYMAYVPEEPNPDYAIHVDMSVYSRYQSELEKAKRESIEFDRVGDQDKIQAMLFFTKRNANSIYQVPVEKPEIVKICNVSGLPGCADNDKSCLCYVAKRVARLKSSSKEKEESEPPKAVIDFATWYSGMERQKVIKAYERYCREVLQGKEVNQ